MQAFFTNFRFFSKPEFQLWITWIKRMGMGIFEQEGTEAGKEEKRVKDEKGGWNLTPRAKGAKVQKKMKIINKIKIKSKSKIKSKNVMTPDSSLRTSHYSLLTPHSFLLLAPAPPV